LYGGGLGHLGENVAFAVAWQHSVAQQGQPCFDRSPAVFGAANAGHDERHHLVAYELVDHRVVAQQSARRRQVETVQQRGHIPGPGPLGKRGGTAHVGE
jgi:hypothetical protein